MRTRTAAFVVAAVLPGTVVTIAQSGTQSPSGYLTPPKAVVEIVDAAPLPMVEVSPAGDMLAVLPRRSLPSIAEMSQPRLRLAGMRINPADNGPDRAPMITGITLRAIATGAERPVQLPSGARIGSLSFSPDGKRTLPDEAHGYAARGFNLHVLAETITWLDKYVKNAPPRRQTDSASR